MRLTSPARLAVAQPPLPQMLPYYPSGKTPCGNRAIKSRPSRDIPRRYLQGKSLRREAAIFHRLRLRGPRAFCSGKVHGTDTPRAHNSSSRVAGSNGPERPPLAMRIEESISLALEPWMSACSSTWRTGGAVATGSWRRRDEGMR